MFGVKKLQFMLLSMIIFSALFALCCSAVAAGNPVWQIGQFDNNYSEFALKEGFGSYPSKFPNDVTFRVGKDDPALSWPMIHPGPVDTWAGGKVHPFTIIFDLPQEPKGTFALKLDLNGVHSGFPPIINVEVNGHKGTVKLPKVECTDALLSDVSKCKECLIEVGLPASAFVRGENRIVITTDKGSWIVYDALSLTNDPSQVSVKKAEKLEIKPTIRFVRHDSRLKQVLELSAQFTPGVLEAVAKIRVGEKTTSETLHPDIFGIINRELCIDEVSEPSDAVITVDLDGQATSATCKVRPERHWNVYVQASTHVDIGYTDFQAKVKELHNTITSKAMELCKEHPEFKWNTETSWVVDNYLSMMPKEDVDAFIQLARQGRIGTQAIYGHMLTENLSHEEMIRDMYFTKSVSDKYGIPCDYALSCDVPTFSASLPTILAQSGIKYFSAGINLYRAHSYNRLFNKSPFYWQGPDGSRVLACWGYGYGVASGLGLTASVETTAVELEKHIRFYDHPDYPSDAVLVFGAFGDNNPNAPLADLVKVTRDWNTRYAYPKVIFCRGPEFFEYLEATCKDKIKTMQGDGGCYWEDGVGSSALETSLNRVAKEELTVAEKLHSLNSALGGSGYPKVDFDLAWKNAVLYDEHTWGAYCSFTDPTAKLTIAQWNYKSAFAHKAKKLSGDIVNQGMADLAKLVGAKEPSVVVFNPHSWPVSGPVQVKNDNGELVEFWVDNVSAMGYKTYPYASKAARSEPAKTVLENRFYRLQFDPTTGAVKSLYDKELGRELVDVKATYGLNQYIYIAGYTDGFKDVTRDGSTPAVMMTSEIRPYGSVVKFKGSAYKTPEWTSEIVLYDDAKRIDFINSVNKLETNDREAGYFAFPFAVANPFFRLCQPNGVLSPEKDMLDGACMQWYCVQDYVAVNGDGCSVVWSAVDSPLVTLCDINRETFKSPIPITNSHLYAYAFNNYWDTNYRASQGPLPQFRFSLTSQKEYDPIAATRFGQSVRNPLLGAQSKGSARAKDAVSLVSVDSPNVIVQAVKRAESGDGYIVRLREVASKKTQAAVTLRLGKTSEVWSCNLLEDKQAKLKVSKGTVKIVVPANGLATLLIR